MRFVARLPPACVLVSCLVACGGSSEETTPQVASTSGGDARSSCTAGATVVPSEAARTKASEYADYLRSLNSDSDWDAVNTALDAGYHELSALGPEGRSAVRAVVEAELAQPSPNDFLLLDLGRFLYATDCADRAVARRALDAIDPDAPLVVVGAQDLFRFAYRVASSGDPDVLATLDRIVTSRRRTVYVPEHALEIDPALQGVFLYGSHSVAAADHVVARLAHDEENRDLLLAILGWIGRPEHVPAVAAIARIDGDETTIRRIVAFAMIVGGPAGRRAVLDLPTSNLSPEANAYLDEIRDDVEATRWPEQELASAEFERLSDDELRARLSAMVANGGRDDELDPRSLLVNGVPNQELLDRLASIRVAMLGRLSDEALDDVQLTNRFFNLVGYRPEPSPRDP